MAKRFNWHCHSSRLTGKRLIGLALVVLIIVGFLPGDPVAAGANIWTWNSLATNVNGVYSDSTNPSVVYAVTHNGTRLYRSVNGGSTWTQATRPNLTDYFWYGATQGIDVVPGHSTMLYANAFANGGSNALYRSTDGGNTWQPLNISGVLGMSYVDSSELYRSADGDVLRSNDAGDTWQPVGQLPASCTCEPGSFECFAYEVRSIEIAPSAPQTMLMGVDAGASGTRLCKTTDSGQTWSPLDHPSLNWSGPVQFDPKSSSVIYLGAAGGGWKSTNGGESWAPIANGLTEPRAFLIDPNNTQVMYALDQGTVQESSNGGGTWQPLDNGIQGLTVASMALASQNPRKLLATTYSSGLWELERTSVQDFGLTINQAALFTNSPQVTLALSAPAGTSEMQIANDGGFAGTNWEAYAPTKPWTLITYGSQVLPRTVYARFRNGGQTSGLYLDDIILDLTTPTGSVAITETASSQAAIVSQGLGTTHLRTSDPLTQTIHLPFISLSWQPGMRAVTLQLVASDAESGIGSVLISNQPDFAGANWQNYVGTLLWQVPELGTTTVSVQFRDRAGNLSPVYTALTTAP